MALKKRLTTAPDASIAEHYKQQGNEWVLDLEGDEPAPNPKIDEFRQSAIEAKKERDRLAKELSDLQKQRDELASKVAPKEKEAQDLAGQVSNIQRLLDEERAARTNAEKKARAENFRSSLVNAAQTHKIRDEKASRALELIAGSVYKRRRGRHLQALRERTDHLLKAQGPRDQAHARRRVGGDPEDERLQRPVLPATGRRRQRLIQHRGRRQQRSYCLDLERVTEADA